MRFPSLLVSSAAALILGAAACGPTVFIEGEPGAESGAGGFGAPAGGFGASGDGASAPSGGSGAGTSGSGSGSGTGTSGSGTASSGSGGGGANKAWALGFGASGHQHLRGLVSDQAGNVIAVGSFDGVMDVGSGPLAQKGLRSGFVLKLDAKGKVLWSQTLIADDCAAEAVSLSEAGELLVTGSVKGSLTVGTKQLPGGDGIFVAKLDAGSGAPSWMHTYGTSTGMQADRGLSIAGTVDGGALVGGVFAGALDLGTGPLPSSSGVFVLAIDAAGLSKWSTALAGKTVFVAASPAGHAIVATNTENGVMTALDLDANGTSQWSHTYSPGTFSAVSVDASGNALFVGSTKTADFGGGPLPSPLPSGEAFLVSLDPKGKHRFTRGLPFDDFQSSAAALSINGGTTAVTGSYVHHPSPGTTVQSAFMVTFDAAGTKLKSQTFGPTDGFGSKVTQTGLGLAPAPEGAFYIGGDFYMAIDVAGKHLTGEGTSDVFVARLAP